MLCTHQLGHDSVKKIVHCCVGMSGKNSAQKYLTPNPQPNPFEGMCCAKLRNVIWKLFEDPNSSTAAKVSRIIFSQTSLLVTVI